MNDLHIRQHFILPHRTETAVLLIPESDKWMLPALLPEENPEYPFKVYEAGMGVNTLCEMEVIALYSPCFRKDEDGKIWDFVFALENRSDTENTPSGARWVNPDTLKTLELVHDFQREVLETYFTEQITGAVPVQRAPWAKIGWWDRVHRWIQEQVSLLGLTLTEEIQYVRKWCLTCVLKVPTNTGNLYFKAVPPTFSREIAATHFLAEKIPQHTPEIVAYEAAENWMLLRDFGGMNLQDSKNLAWCETALRQFAALQVKMMPHVETLLGLGALDYRNATLSARMDALFADEQMLVPDHRMTAADIARIKAYAPRIRAMIDALDALNIAPTIMHCDFHLGNIAMAEPDRAIFFDWTDTAVGSPFFDVYMYLDRVAEAIDGSHETLDRLRDVYLDAFGSLAPPEILRRALELGEKLALLHQAVNYHHLLKDIEPAERWVLDVQTYFLRELLKVLDANAE